MLVTDTGHATCGATGVVCCALLGTGCPADAGGAAGDGSVLVDVDVLVSVFVVTCVASAVDMAVAGRMNSTMRSFI